jgi:hypothetical protein
MTFRAPLPALAAAVAAAGVALAAAGCSGHITPLGPDSAPVRHLGSPIVVQVMRNQAPTQAGRCPAGSVDLFGSEPDVPRLVGVLHSRFIRGSTHTPTPTPTPTAPPASSAGIACYVRVGKPVTVTSAAVYSVTSYQHQPGPSAYGFVVAFPAADVRALTALIHQAYASGDAMGMSVAGKLWQAPQVRHRFIALRGEQINLLSRNQAVQLHRLLVASG